MNEAGKDELPKVFTAPTDRHSPMSGAELRAIRIGLGLNQTHLAKIVGHPQGVVSRWEKSESVPDDVRDAVIEYGLWVERETLRKFNHMRINAQPPVAHLEDDLTEPYLMQTAISTGRALLALREGL